MTANSCWASGRGVMSFLRTGNVGMMGSGAPGTAVTEGVRRGVAEKASSSHAACPLGCAELCWGHFLPKPSLESLVTHCLHLKGGFKLSLHPAPQLLGSLSSWGSLAQRDATRECLRATPNECMALCPGPGLPASPALLSPLATISNLLDILTSRGVTLIRLPEWHCLPLCLSSSSSFPASPLLSDSPTQYLAVPPSLLRAPRPGIHT